MAANLNVTAADVLAYAGASTRSSTAGEALTVGQTLYRHTDGKLYKADASSAAKANCVGVALNNAAANQPIHYIAEGGVNPGAVVAIGTIYGVSDTAGGIEPISERAAADFVTILGIASTASRIDLAINAAGVAIPGA